MLGGNVDPSLVAVSNPSVQAPSAPQSPASSPRAPSGEGPAIAHGHALAQKAKEDKEWFEKRQKEFLAIFLAAQNWELETADPQKDRKFVFKQKGTNLTAEIKVLADNSLSFSGSATADIARAATAYALSEKDRNITFYVEAKDAEEAKNFIKNLGLAGFEIDSIRTIKLGGIPLEQDKFLEMMVEIKKDIPRYKSGTRPIPPQNPSL